MTCECGHEDDEHRVNRRGARVDCQVEGCGCAYFEHAAECEDGAEGAMTLNELRPLAEAAKAWRPWHWCGDSGWMHVRFNGTIKSEYCGKCPPCLGAASAVEDIAASIDRALVYIEKKYPINADWRVYAIAAAEDAKTIASYFGDSGAVGEFARAVEEACK